MLGNMNDTITNLSKRMEQTDDFLTEFQMAQQDLIRSVQSSESIERLKLENEQNHQIMLFLGNEHQQTVQELTEMVEELFLKDQVENDEDSMRREIIRNQTQYRSEIVSILKTQQRLKLDDNWNQLNVQLLEDEVYEMSERIETLSNLKRQSDDLNLMKNRKITDLESRVKELESEVSDLQERLDAEFDNEADVLDILKDFYFDKNFWLKLFSEARISSKLFQLLQLERSQKALHFLL